MANLYNSLLKGIKKVVSKLNQSPDIFKKIEFNNSLARDARSSLDPHRSLAKAMSGQKSYLTLGKWHNIIVLKTARNCLGITFYKSIPLVLALANGYL